MGKGDRLSVRERLEGIVRDRDDDDTLTMGLIQEDERREGEIIAVNKGFVMGINQAYYVFCIEQKKTYAPIKSLYTNF